MKARAQTSKKTGAANPTIRPPASNRKRASDPEAPTPEQNRTTTALEAAPTVFTVGDRIVAGASASIFSLILVGRTIASIAVKVRVSTRAENSAEI